MAIIPSTKHHVPKSQGIEDAKKIAYSQGSFVSESTISSVAAQTIFIPSNGIQHRQFASGAANFKLLMQNGAVVHPVKYEAEVR